MRSQTLTTTVKHTVALLCCVCAAVFVFGGANASAQSARVIAKNAKNRPLPSLAQAAIQARGKVPSFKGPHREVPNFTGRSRTQEGGFQGPDALLQDFNGPNPYLAASTAPTTTTTPSR